MTGFVDAALEAGGKTCTKCGQSRPFPAGFYRERSCPSGFRGDCKQCVNARSREIRGTPSGRAAKRKSDQVYEQSRAERAMRHATPKGQAREAVRRAVRFGRIVKPSACERCLKATPTRQLAGHHRDYAKPLDVEWLCAECHNRGHAKC